MGAFISQKLGVFYVNVLFNTLSLLIHVTLKQNLFQRNLLHGKFVHFNSSKAWRIVGDIMDKGQRVGWGEGHWTGNPKAWGTITVRLEFQMHGGGGGVKSGISSGNRQEPWKHLFYGFKITFANEAWTGDSAEDCRRRIQDKHSSISDVFKMAEIKTHSTCSSQHILVLMFCTSLGHCKVNVGSICWIVVTRKLLIH